MWTRLFAHLNELKVWLLISTHNKKGAAWFLMVTTSQTKFLFIDIQEVVNSVDIICLKPVMILLDIYNYHILVHCVIFFSEIIYI